MRKEFELDELAILKIFDEGSRQETIRAIEISMDDLRQDPDAEDPEMIGLMTVILDDLRAMTDEEYEGIDLSEMTVEEEETDDDNGIMDDNDGDSETATDS